MLFMVIERFRDNDIVPVYQRVQDSGRMLPDGLMVRVNYPDLRVASRRNVTRWIDVVFPVFFSHCGSNGNRLRRACRNERVARLEASPARTSMGSTAHTCAAGTADLSNRPRIISLARCARHSLTRRCKVRNCALLA